MIPLQFRDTNEVVPILKNMFSTRARISQLDSRVVVACDDATFQQIKQLVASLDHRPQQLLVEVKVARKEASDRSEQSIKISANPKSPSAQLGMAENKMNSAEGSLRSVSVLEGSRASFHTVDLLGPVTGILASDQGFTAMPKLGASDTVNVEIDAHNDKDRRVTFLSTNVNGKIGAWIPIGSVQETNTQGRMQQFLWLRVRLAP